MRLLFVIVVLSLVVPISALAQSGSLVELFRRISPAVGALYAQNQQGSLEFNCTVTATDKIGDATALITASHCVTKGVSYLVTFDGRRFYNARVWKLPPEEADPKKYTRPPGVPETDMAYFLIEEKLTLPTVNRATHSAVEPGQRIVNIAYPLGISKTRYEGIISGRFDRPGANQNGYLLLQVFGAPGSSGSAIINADTGEIVGVLVSAMQRQIGLPVIFATPIEYEHYLVEVPDGMQVQKGSTKEK